MSKQTDLREIQRLTEDAAIDARKLLVQPYAWDSLKRALASADWQKDGGRYIPMASTWLNGRRWEDEDKPAPSARPDRPRQQRPFHTEIIDGEEVVIFDDAQTT